MAHKKLKLLYLAKLFQEQTDEAHPVTVGDMIGYLGRLGIPAERKAIYEDLELLEQFGMDIVRTRSKTYGYYLGQRSFELPELAMLIDVVQASPFLTAKKSMELISKLERLTSAAQAGRLRRQVYVLNRVKTQNEQLYYNIDGIHQAINATATAAGSTASARRRCAWTGTTTLSPTGRSRANSSTSGWTASAASRWRRRPGPPCRRTSTPPSTCAPSSTCTAATPSASPWSWPPTC